MDGLAQLGDVASSAVDIRLNERADRLGIAQAGRGHAGSSAAPSLHAALVSASGRWCGMLATKLARSAASPIESSSTIRNPLPPFASTRISWTAEFQAISTVRNSATIT